MVLIQRACIGHYFVSVFILVYWQMNTSVGYHVKIVMKYINNLSLSRLVRPLDRKSSYLNLKQLHWIHAYSVVPYTTHVFSIISYSLAQLDHLIIQLLKFPSTSQYYFIILIDSHSYMFWMYNQCINLNLCNCTMHCYHSTCGMPSHIKTSQSATWDQQTRPVATHLGHLGSFQPPEQDLQLEW